MKKFFLCVFSLVTFPGFGSELSVKQQADNLRKNFSDEFFEELIWLRLTLSDALQSLADDKDCDSAQSALNDYVTCKRFNLFGKKTNFREQLQRGMGHNNYHVPWNHSWQKNHTYNFNKVMCEAEVGLKQAPKYFCEKFYLDREFGVNIKKLIRSAHHVLYTYKSPEDSQAAWLVNRIFEIFGVRKPYPASTWRDHFKEHKKKILVTGLGLLAGGLYAWKKGYFRGGPREILRRVRGRKI